MKHRKYQRKNIGKRFCKVCVEFRLFVWTPSANTWTCEVCDYEAAIDKQKAILDSEEDFLNRLRTGEIP